MNPLTTYLYQALSEPIGLLFEVSQEEVTPLQQLFYRLRKETGDEALKALSIRPTSQGVILVHKHPNWSSE